MPRSANEILRQAYGPNAGFREGQREAVRAVWLGQRTLVVQRTGWGKSLVYFLATALLREAGRGPTLLVSPLLALMRNQVEAAKKIGVRAEALNSANRGEWSAILQRVRDDEVDLLLVSPERLGEPSFRDQVLAPLEPRIGLLVIDEAHCISDWGHDFRPDFRRILATVNRLPATTPVLATTATANDRVIADIRSLLGDVEVMRGPLTRASLAITVHELPDQATRLAWLSENMPKLPGTGIVYVLTVEDAKRVTRWLEKSGISAAAYYGALATEERLRLEDDFLSNRYKCLVATTALGMGYDKPDVGFVVHFQRPGSIIAYYQQIGRAGREIPRAEVVLLTGREDDRITEFFIESAFPARACFDEILHALLTGPRREDHLMSRTNFRRGEISQALKIAEVEGAVRQEREGWVLVDPTWSAKSLPIEHIRSVRMRELDQMREFTTTKGCRMRFLARALDDPSADADCGRCDRCSPGPATAVSHSLVGEAIAFLRGARLVIEPKRMYPPGVEGEGRKKIPEDLRLEYGVALSMYDDPGWGKLVAQGKYREHRFSDELLMAAAAALRETKATWLTWIPTALNADYGPRLAEMLGIEAVDAVRKVRPTEPQKTMHNATRQYENVFEAYQVVDSRPGRCLLVDDVVSSGWTLAIVGAELRRAGVPEVVPFALAQTYGAGPS